MAKIKTKAKLKSKTSSASSLVALAVLLSVHLELVSMRADAFQCQSEGFFVKPEDCKRFVRCVDQWQRGQLTAHQFSCPPGK